MKTIICCLLSFLLISVLLCPCTLHCQHQATDIKELLRKGNGAIQNGQYDQALLYLTEAQDIMVSTGKQDLMPVVKLRIGICYSKKRQYDQALSYLLESDDILARTGKKSLAPTVKQNIGMTYFALKKYQEALSYLVAAYTEFNEFHDKPNTAVTAANIRLAYRALAKNDKTLSYHEEVMKLCKDDNPCKTILTELEKDAHINEGADKANDLTRKGRDAFRNKQYDQALSNFMKADDILSRTGKKNLAPVIKLNIGITYFQLNKFKEALPYLDAAYTELSKSNDKNTTVIAALHMGATYTKLNQSEKALSYYEDFVRLSRIINQRHGLVPVLNLLGLHYCAQTEFDKGLRYLEEALEIVRQENVPKDIAWTLSNTGILYGSSFVGKYHVALSYLQESLRIYQEINNQKEVARCNSRLATIYASLGQYDKALQNIREAYNINISLKNEKDVSKNLKAIGSIYYTMGQHDKALHYFYKALELRTQTSNQELSSIKNSIGLVYRSLGEYEKAITFFNDALQVEKMFQMQDAIILMNLGFTYTLQQNYEQAEKALLRVEEMRKKATGIKWKGVPYLIELYIMTKRYDDALSYLAQMQPEWYADDRYRILFHTQLGSVLKGNNKLREASIEFLKALTLCEDMRAGLKEKEGFFGAGYAGGYIRPYRSLVAVLSERALKNDAVTDTQFSLYGKDLASAAFYFAESTKARVLLEDIAASSLQSHSTTLPENLRERELEIMNQLSGINDQWEEAYIKGNEKEFRALIERKKALKTELDSLIDHIGTKYPKYVALHYPKAILPEAIPLKENEVLLEFAIGEDATYLFKVKKGGIEGIYKIEQRMPEIEKLITEYTLLLQNPRSARDQIIRSGKQLYEIILEKSLKGITPKANLIIIPDGVLGLLPFETLPVEVSTDQKNIIYAGDRYAITYYQSASVLALNRILSASAAQKNLFALGDPIYSIDDRRYEAYKRGLSLGGFSEDAKSEQGSLRALATNKRWGKTTNDEKESSALEYPPLPETAIEIQTIAGFFKTSLKPPDILLNINANESTLRKIPLKNYRYLHFATHADLAGKVQGINEPFLLLGQLDNNPEDNGFLTLTKVLNLNIDADLVVLSACLTARGKTMEGEGVMNFVRAFQHAGARSVVSSLWEVASKETVEYMAIFYSKLKQGMTRAESLAFARNEVRKKYPHPFYWAAFVLYGEQ